MPAPTVTRHMGTLVRISIPGGGGAFITVGQVKSHGEIDVDLPVAPIPQLGENPVHYHLWTGEQKYAPIACSFWRYIADAAQTFFRSVVDDPKAANKLPFNFKIVTPDSKEDTGSAAGIKFTEGGADAERPGFYLDSIVFYPQHKMTIATS